MVILGISPQNIHYLMEMSYVWKLAMPQNGHFYYILENMGPLSYSLDLRGRLIIKKKQAEEV